MRPLEYKEGEDVVKDIKEEFKTAYATMDKKTEDMAQVIALVKEGKAEKKDVTDLTNTLEGIKADFKSMTERAEKADELLAKLSRPGANLEGEAKSLADIIRARPDYEAQAKAFSAARKDARFTFDLNGEIETKAITSGAASAGKLIFPERRPGIIEQQYRPLSIRDLIPATGISTNSVEWVQERLFTNNAAPVAEGTLKPESDITFEQKTGTVKTIAHFMTASLQVLADAAGLASMLENRGRLGYRLGEEDQLLLGDGTGQNLTGLYTNAPAFVATGIPGGVAANLVDRVRWAKLQVRKGFYSADSVVLNPEDWAKIELLKDADGAYLYSSAFTGAPQRFWGMRVVESDVMPVGNFMLGAFGLAAEIRDRQSITVDVSTEDRDNFVKNMSTIRIEGRLMLNILRPSAFLKGAVA